MIGKNVVIMGGGTSAWISALYFLNKNKDLDLGLNIKLVSSPDIQVIGVGEGTTVLFNDFLKICKINESEFLKETKGSFKSGIKFSNWNFDNEYYYHLFDSNYIFPEKVGCYQYVINNDLDVPQKDLQRKFFERNFDLIESNKIIPQASSYHFSAELVISFLKKQCLKFKNFSFIERKIEKIIYTEEGFVKSLILESSKELSGDFFVNCLGFDSSKLLNEEYFDIKDWSKYILNNSAFAIQVKNSEFEEIEPYTTSTAQKYGWSWKIPQYEKTGYGYVYSNNFIDDEDKLYNDLIKTYKIKEESVFKTKVVKFKSYYNKNQLYKNCLSLGLASGFVEPLEATSLHMTIFSLKIFFELIENVPLNQKNSDIFNIKLENHWDNVFKFIIFHYFTNNPINDYWNHYKSIQKNKIFNFFEKYTKGPNYIFSDTNYFSISLGLKIKDYFNNFTQIKLLNDNIHHFLEFNSKEDLGNLSSNKEILNLINNMEF